jgi:hypothetical protein
LHLLIPRKEKLFWKAIREGFMYGVAVGMYLIAGFTWQKNGGMKNGYKYMSAMVTCCQAW